ncbi:MAG: ribonuclease P protein component [Planctomycetales bacterium]|nr:ribonuclease P protein component [Planctomycetales bacterium]
MSSKQPSHARFPKSARLLKSSEFDEVFQRRCSCADDVLVIYGRRTAQAQTRLGLVVSRKCGNAVRRNRWKRAIREAFRRLRSELPEGIDLAVLPRPHAEPQAAKVAQSLKKLVRQLDQRLRQRRGRSPRN